MKKVTVGGYCLNADSFKTVEDLKNAGFFAPGSEDESEAIEKLGLKQKKQGKKQTAEKENNEQVQITGEIASERYIDNSADSAAPTFDEGVE